MHSSLSQQELTWAPPQIYPSESLGQNIRESFYQALLDNPVEDYFQRQSVNTHTRFTMASIWPYNIFQSLERLPKNVPFHLRTYTSLKPTLTRRKAGICTVCCQQITSGVRVVKLQCKHRYHLQCITKWLRCKNTCPLCRAQVK